MSIHRYLLVHSFFANLCALIVFFEPRLCHIKVECRFLKLTLIQFRDRDILVALCEHEARGEVDGIKIRVQALFHLFEIRDSFLAVGSLEEILQILPQILAVGDNSLLPISVKGSSPIVSITVVLGRLIDPINFKSLQVLLSYFAKYFKSCKGLILFRWSFVIVVGCYLKSLLIKFNRFLSGCHFILYGR